MIHVHNGDITASMARRVGLPGEHVAFREALVGGPVVEDENWIATRSRFLAESFDQDVLRTSNMLFEQEQTLAASKTHDEVVLWFEHDLFCLVHLLYVLPRVPPATSYLVWHDHPLSESTQEDLWLLYRRRGAVTSDILVLARAAWSAYTSPDPRALNALLTATARPFPFLQEGLLLHAARFPSTRNGLGIVEQRVLEFVSEGARDFEALFNRFTRAQPRFGFGDSEIMRHLRAMAKRPVPLLTLLEAGPATNAAIDITDQGVAALAGMDDVEVNGIDLWLGGVHLTPEHLWRWDPQRGEIVDGSGR